MRGVSGTHAREKGTTTEWHHETACERTFKDLHSLVFSALCSLLFCSLLQTSVFSLNRPVSHEVVTTSNVIQCPPQRRITELYQDGSCFNVTTITFHPTKTDVKGLIHFICFFGFPLLPMAIQEIKKNDLMSRVGRFRFSWIRFSGV